MNLRIDETGELLPLHEGRLAIARGAGGLQATSDQNEALVWFWLDRRGTWLTLAEGTRGVHLNGRRIRRMALLRAGDAVYVDGSEVMLESEATADQPDDDLLMQADAQSGDVRVVLRAIGGKDHGRSFTLEQPRLVGSDADADLRIDDPAFPARHARLALADGYVVLRDLSGADGTTVNGRQVHDALLEPGDQLAFDGQHRFLVEAPGPLQRAGTDAALAFDHDAELPETQEPRQAGWRRWPWLLLAAVLVAAALAGLLMFGSAR